MSDRPDAPEHPAGPATVVTSPRPAADRERVLLLECRLEEMRAALDEARDEADRTRMKLADVSTREADHVRRYGLVHEELAEARAEVVALRRRLDRSEALRAELAGHLFEAGSREDAEELVRLRRKVLSEEQRALVTDRTVARLRERVEELVASRETLLTRIAQWQQLIREDATEAADLSEFLAELRREILDLEHESAVSDAREAALRQRLASAGIDPERTPPEETPEPIVVAEAEPESEIAVELEPEPVAEVPPEPVAATETEPAAEAALELEPEPESEMEPLEEVDAEEEVVASAAPEDVADVEALEDLDAEVEAATDAEPVAATEPEPVADPDREAGSEPDVESEPAIEPLGNRAAQLVAELEGTRPPARQADLLLQLGRSGDRTVVGTVRSWTDSAEPSVRAAAYEALGRLLERSPSELEPHVRMGLTDPDARVRRRVALAAATARGLSAHELLDPLREDPDPQVRRVIRQILLRTEVARDSSLPNRALGA